MSQGQSTVVVRSLLLVLGAVALTVGVWRLARGPVAGLASAIAAHGAAGVSGMPFDALVVAGCALALVLCAAWLLAVTCLVGLEAVAGTLSRPSGWSTRRSWCPALLHRWLLAACGAALVSGLASPAVADAGAVDPWSVAGTAVSGLPVPDRAVGPPRRGNAGAGTVTVTVTRGDTLWSLARDALGGRPSDARTEAAWRRLYRANRERIGNDPDLIFPGTALQMPVLDPTHRKESS
ncbi:MAG TPA: LysM peptidoglycan-binding domain-containing protein [Nocardioidaceae bacterium]|nr:LysM peptidoglycan-binding domain-containing protein [Nocardioidaceae bacterium]